MATIPIRRSRGPRPLNGHRVLSACWTFMLAAAVFAVVGIGILLDLPWLDREGVDPGATTVVVTTAAEHTRTSPVQR